MSTTNKFADTVGKLQGMNPWDVPMNPEIQNHIITLYNAIHGEGGEVFCEREARYISHSIIEDEKKRDVTPLSVFLVFVDLAVKNITLEPGAQPLCYLLNRRSQIKGFDGKEQWQNRCYLSITGYGEILLRQRAGQIRHCDTPTVVYWGDEFGYTERDGRKHVTYSLNINHDPARPIACFIKITRIDSTIDYAVILPEAWNRLAEYSKKQNKGSRVNDLYSSGQGGSIDPGFLIAKCVKHAFKSYPKLPVGRGTVMEAELPEEEQIPDYYDLQDQKPATPAGDPTPQDSFIPADNTSSGVVIDPSDNPYDDNVF